MVDYHFTPVFLKPSNAKKLKARLLLDFGTQLFAVEWIQQSQNDIYVGQEQTSDQPFPGTHVSIHGSRPGKKSGLIAYRIEHKEQGHIFLAPGMIKLCPERLETSAQISAFGEIKGTVRVQPFDGFYNVNVLKQIRVYEANPWDIVTRVGGPDRQSWGFDIFLLEPGNLNAVEEALGNLRAKWPLVYNVSYYGPYIYTIFTPWLMVITRTEPSRP